PCATGGYAGPMEQATVPTLATDEEIEAVAERGAAAGRFGVDTEFMSEGRYRPLLCLAQVVVDGTNGNDPQIVLIDTLRGDPDLTPLAALLADPDIEVILHAGRQDVA